LPHPTHRPLIADANFLRLWFAGAFAATARWLEMLAVGIFVFEVTASEDDLVRAEQAEVDAIIDWLDALTRLAQVSGRTLATWAIDAEAVARCRAAPPASTRRCWRACSTA